jgi:hypothetical protein
MYDIIGLVAAFGFGCFVLGFKIGERLVYKNKTTKDVNEN